MGIVINQSLKSSIWAYLGVLIGFINVLWLYTYFLSTEQIGLFRLIQSSSFLLATFGQIGLGSSVIKFFPTFKNEKGFLGSAILGTIFGFCLLLFLTTFFKSSITSYFSNKSALFIEYLGLTLTITLSIILFQVLEAFSRSLLNIVFPTLLRDVGLRIFTSLAIVLFGLDLIDFDMALFVVVGAYGLNALVLLVYIAHIRKLGIAFEFSFLRNGKLKEVMKYGFYSLLGAGGTQIILQIDSIMLSGMEGLDATGIYAIAFFIGVVIEMPKRSITQVSLALISQAFAKNDFKAINKLYKQTSINQMIIGSLLLIGIWSNIDNIYAFIPNSDTYVEGIQVVLFIALGKLSDMIFGVNGEIIVMSKYYRFNVVAISILAIFSILFNYYLIPIYGLEGAAIASFLAMFGFNLLKFIFVWVKFQFQPFTKRSLLFAGIVCVTLVAERLIPTIGNYVTDTIIRSSLITTVLLVPTYFLKVSAEFNGLLTGILNKMKNTLTRT